MLLESKFTPTDDPSCAPKKYSLEVDKKEEEKEEICLKDDSNFNAERDKNKVRRHQAHVHYRWKSDPN